MPPANGSVQAPVVDVPYSINSLTFNSGDGRFVILGAAAHDRRGGITNNDADTSSQIHIIRVTRTIYVCIVTVSSCIFYVCSINCDTPFFFFRSTINIIIISFFRQTFFRQNIGYSGC